MTGSEPLSSALSRQKTGKIALNLGMIGLTHPFRGGISLYTTLLYRELITVHRVHLVNFHRLYPRLFFPGKTQFDQSQVIFSIGRDQERLIDTLNPVTWIRAVKTLREKSLDMVVIHWWQPFLAPAMAIVGRLLRRHFPVVFLCHNVDPHESSAPTRQMTRFALSSADALIVHSRQDEKTAKEWFRGTPVYRADHPAYDVLPENTESPAAIKHSLGIDPQAKVVLFFGFVRPYKGLKILIEAIARIPREENLVLLIVGEFYEAESVYHDLVRKQDIQDRVTFVAHYVPNEEIARYFCIAETVVLPYTSASQSGIAQIAWAFGCPIVASSIGGLPDIIEDHHTGILVRPNDPDDLARGMREIMVSEVADSIRREMVRQKDRFSWTRMRMLIEQIQRDLSA